MLKFQLVLSLLPVLPSTEEHDYNKDKAPTPYLLQFCRNLRLVSTYKGNGKGLFSSVLLFLGLITIFFLIGQD